MTPLGGPLTTADLASLAERWIDSPTAQAQLLRRVDSAEGGRIVGQNAKADHAGLLIPNVWPGADYIREYRLRRDHPEVENGKPRRRYVSPPGRGNLLYFPIGTPLEPLADARLPLIITEGEFKTIALDRAARHGLPHGQRRFLAAGLGGAWNWRGTVGKTTDADGTRIDVKGPITDLAHLVLDDRKVLILFDADLESNDSVRASRFLLTKELRARAAQVHWFPWPDDRPAQAKGIDDLLAAIGPDAVLTMIGGALERPAGPPDLIAYHFADTGNAERLVALYGADLRYCHDFKKWVLWDGQRWAVDATEQARKLAKRTMVTFLRQGIETSNEDAQKFARSSLDARRQQAMLSLAQPELPILANELDQARHLLNFKNGTVDLRTGKLRPHRRSDFITRIVHHDFNPAAECPRWQKFLNEVMSGANELVEYLQLALGYSLTGEATAKAVFMAQGEGDNGKTTMLSVVSDLISEYSTNIALDVLTTRDESNNVAAARAQLLGVRFARSSETEEGQRLSAARLKRICQGPGGQIEACRKYENPITFAETHKLWIDANHKPNLPASDIAVWSRLHLIPFTVTFAKDQQDAQLRDKLMAEAEGILAWLVAGAARWYAEGLPESETVKGATQDWRNEVDHLRVFLDEQTRREEGSVIASHALFRAYAIWCERSHERNALAQKKFTAQLEAIGHTRERQKEGMFWQNLAFDDE